jgi:hypothetical protein
LGPNRLKSSSDIILDNGSKHVEIQGLTDKSQITGVFCGTLLGEFLPIQLIYGGKTPGCLPYSFPKDWQATYTANH